MSSGPQVTSGGHGSSGSLVPRASALLSRVFMSDPAVTYMLSSLSPAERAAYIPEYFRTLLTAGTMNGASIESIADRIGNGASKEEGGKGAEGESGEWKSCGILVPPGKSFENPWTLLPSGMMGMTFRAMRGGFLRTLMEFPSVANSAKKKGLKGQKRYYYVFFVGTEAAAEGQGFCTAIMREYQARGAKEGVPVWLEATTEKSMRLYSKLGWELVEEMVVGKGKAKADGTLMKGGEGVKFWAMVWWPPAKTGEI